jgi:hypothetical protein
MPIEWDAPATGAPVGGGIEWDKPTPSKKVPAFKPKGQGSYASPFDLSGGQSRTAIPKGSYYRDPKGNIRLNENADAGNPIVTAPRKSATRGQSRGALADVVGAAAAYSRAVPFADEFNAAVGTGADLFRGRVKPRLAPGDNPLGMTPLIRGVGDAFDRNMDLVGQTEDDFRQRRPLASATAEGAGIATSLVVPAGKVAAPLKMGPRATAAIEGGLNAAAQGYVSGLGSKGTFEQRLNSGAIGGGVGAFLGGTLGGLGVKGAPRKKPAQGRKDDVQILREIGAGPTPGQAMGGIVKNVEDLGLRVPIFGSAVQGARTRVNDRLQRGVALRALSPIGAKLPKEIRPGFEMVEFVDDAIGKVYNDAADLVPMARPDQQLADDIAAIAQRSSDLPESQRGLFESIARDRLTRIGQGASGRQVKAIHEELGKIERNYTRGTGSDPQVGDMIGDLRMALMGMVGRADPRAAELVAKADRAWVDYSIMNKAAEAASLQGGSFVPSQLSNAARQSAKTLGSKMAGKGKGSLQDVAAAAGRVLPDQFGNPGTANTLALGAGAYGAFADPLTTAAVGGGLVAASTPYMMMGRKVLEELPPEVSRSQAQLALTALDDLIAKDPSVQILKDQLLQRLARYGGAAAGSASSTPPPTQGGILSTGTR